MGPVPVTRDGDTTPVRRSLNWYGAGTPVTRPDRMVRHRAGGLWGRGDGPARPWWAMAVTAAGHRVRVGWLIPVALTAFLVVFGIHFAVESLASLKPEQERRTRVLGEVISADEPPPTTTTP